MRICKIGYDWLGSHGIGTKAVAGFRFGEEEDESVVSAFGSVKKNLGFR
jgi:hypothetical protein